MPNDNQPARSYIAAVLARADGATEDGAPQYRVEGREDGFLLTWLVVNKNNDELERWEAWIPQGGYVDKERQARNVATLLNQCEAETKHARQDIPTLAKIALRAIGALEQHARQRNVEECRRHAIGEGHMEPTDSDDAAGDFVDAYNTLVEESRAALADINALVKGSQ